VKRYPVDVLTELSGMSASALCRKAGVSSSTIAKSRSRHGLTEEMAERLAVAAGFLPYLIWPEWLEDVIEDCSVECADERCHTRFVPSRRNNIYCSPGCTSRASARAYSRRRREDPAVRAEEAQRAKEYRAQDPRTSRLKDSLRRPRERDARIARDRARYRTNRDELLLQQRIRDHYRRGHETRGCPPGCPLNQQVAA
jgi:lambda repressor-like predicted transcriptional regulator